MSDLHLETTFLAAMQSAGLDYQGEIVADGALHRVKVNGDRNPNAWYVLHPDHPAAGAFGCWKHQINETWCAVDSEALTEAERAERDRRWKEQQAARDADRQRQNQGAAIKAQAILDAAHDASNTHPYLIRKGVKAYPGVKIGAWPQSQKNGCLLIPLRGGDGQLATVQAIFPEKPATGSDKYLLKDGAKKGAFFAIGDIHLADTVIIAEGYATAATLHEATGYAAVMAIDAGNLRPVAEILKALYPAKRLIIAADNDRFTEGNPGLAKATAAAKAIKAALSIPEFSESEAGTDFNDLAALHGLESVKAAITGAARPDAAKKVTANDPYRGSDDANADLFLKQHGSDVRFCPPWNKWLLWTGTHWRIDERLDIKAKAETVAITLYREAAASGDPDERRKIAGLAFTLETVGGRSAMLTAAQHKCVVHHSDLDKGHFLLNASNGTIQLQTGALRPHERRDLLTHDVEIPYQANATAPTWLAFLNSIFDGDMALIAFIQRAVGYSLTGDVREQVLFICHGVGSNGKSVFLNILRKLLGHLAIQAAPDLLMVSKSERHPTDQADLFAKRLVVCQETGEGRRFNETLVKQLTGGDGIRARRMREDFWEFNPTHKLWLSTNHKPEIRGTDHAIWRRIRLIPFNVKFTDDGPAKKYPLMEAKLTAELPGILAWALQGCLDWQRHGLNPPDAVSQATNNYQAEMDVLAAWMKECCFLKKTAETKASDLYASYTAWCEQSGEYPEKQRKFGMRLKERGFDNFLSTGGYSKWRGIGLRSPVEEVEEVDEVSGFQPRESGNPVYRESSSTRSTSSTPDSAPFEAAKINPLDTRILAALAGIPGGLSIEDIHRQIGNNKGTSVAMIEAALFRLVKAGDVSKINGKWVAS